MSTDFWVLNVYRSGNAGKEFLHELVQLIDLERNVFICGDFNFCSIDEDSHQIYKLLKSLQFVQLVPEATHQESRSLDHSYIYIRDKTLDVVCNVNGCYFSDHDKIILCVDDI